MRLLRLFCAFALVGCSRGPSARPIAGPADLVGGKCAVVTGNMLADLTESVQPGIEYVWFNDCGSAVEALRLRKVDAVPLDDFTARRYALGSPGDFAVTAPYADMQCGFFFRKGSPWRERTNRLLARLRANGELKRLIDKWCSSDDPSVVPLERSKRPAERAGRAGTLRFASSFEREPACFRRSDGVAGFEIDFIDLLADEFDLKVEIVDITMGALAAAVETDKADVGGGGVTITEERAKKVDFSDGYFDVRTVFLVNRDRLADDIRSLSDLAGRHVAHMSADLHRARLEALQKGIVFDPYSEIAFAFESLRKKKIDALSIGRTFAEVWSARYPGEFRVIRDYSDDVIAFLTPRNSPHRAAVDAEIRRMRESGEIPRIIAKWIDAAKRGVVPELPSFPPPPEGATVVRIASAAQAEPWCFVANGELAGAEIEILSTVLHRLGWRAEWRIYSWGGMIDAINGGRADISNGNIYSDGIEFSGLLPTEKIADEKMCVMTRDPSFRGVADDGVGFLGSVRESFMRTFVTESRWLMMARGFGVTLAVFFFSALLGTVLAFPVWLARSSRFRAVSLVARGFISLVQGTPILVTLMVLFYVVFAGVDIAGAVVAVIGFGMNSAVYIGETLRSGVDSVPPGQREAALALGYSRVRAFFRFIFPQAARSVLPVYRGQLVWLLKATSVVGYIAINDLTKASDLIRSRTYESFFPILSTAFIYFVASWLLACALDRLGKR